MADRRQQNAQNNTVSTEAAAGNPEPAKAPTTSGFTAFFSGSLGLNKKTTTTGGNAPTNMPAVGKTSQEKSEGTTIYF